MNGSAALGWLLMGPLLIMSLSYALWTLTGWPALKCIAISALSLAGLVALIAFVLNLVNNRVGESNKHD
jgi:hypothetical protein